MVTTSEEYYDYHYDSIELHLLSVLGRLAAWRDEDQFAGERALDASECARVEVFEDAVAVVLAERAE